MQTITTSWPVGQFKTMLTADVDESQMNDLASLGLRFLGQRNTEVDKILGGFETVDGKSKRKVDYKRNEVDYSEDFASKLKASFASLEFPDSTKETPHVLATVVDIEKYEGGGAEPKYAPEKRTVNFYLAANDGKLKDGVTPRSATSFASNRGIVVPVDDAKWSEDTVFLAAVKAWADEESKKRLTAKD